MTACLCEQRLHERAPKQLLNARSICALMSDHMLAASALRNPQYHHGQRC